MFPVLKIWAAWPYMLPVSLLRCKNEALKNCTSKASLSASKECMKIDKWPDSPYSSPPIDYCVRINGEPDCLFILSHRFLDSDCINFKTFAFLAVYWPFWTSLYNTDIKVFFIFLLILYNVKQCLWVGPGPWLRGKYENPESQEV